MLEVLLLYLIIPGRVNFLQQSRYGKYGEQRYRQQFQVVFDWLSFNSSLVESHLGSRLALAFDPRHDVAGIQWTEISTAAYVQVGYVVIGGSFLAYIFIMTAQRLLRPTVVSMYNYMQPIVASIAAIIMGLGVFGWEKGVAIALVFLGVYIVTKSKSKADFEKEGKKA